MPDSFVIGASQRADDFGPDAEMGRVARAVCRAQLDVLLAHEPGTRRGGDAEQLHKMRVASRRLRAALRVFGRAFARPERERLQIEVRWIGRTLGTVRDLDVQRAAIPTWRERLGAEPAAGWRQLSKALAHRHSDARTHMLHALDSSRYRRAREAIESACSERGYRTAPKRAHVPIGRELPRLLRRPSRRFLDAVKRYRRSQAPADAHALRIAGKGLRYATELLRPVLSPKQVRRAAKLPAFQDALGELQDIAAFGLLAVELAPDAEDDPQYATVLGRLEGYAAATARRSPLIVESALHQLRPRRLIAALDRD